MVMAKALANRLKLILVDIISENQNAFVAGRHITDSIVLAYEVNHYLKRRRTVKIGHVALKLDISKVYDKLEWSFVEGMLRNLGFYESWIELMMLCVKSVKFKVSFNDELLGPILSQRGLR